MFPELSLGAWPLLVAFLLTAAPPNQAIARSRQKSGPVPPVGIVVRLYNQAQVPADILRRAEGEVAQIVRPAGIDMSFVDCPITREDGPKYFACREAVASPFVVKIRYSQSYSSFE